MQRMEWQFKSMEASELEGRHAYYLPTLVILSRIPWWKPIKINDIDLGKGVIQRAYKEIKEENFEGNLIDYLCWISLCYMVIKFCTAIIKIRQVIKSRKERGWLFRFWGEDIKNAARLYLKDKNNINIAFDKYFETEDIEVRERYIKSLNLFFEEELNFRLKYEPESTG